MKTDRVLTIDEYREYLDQCCVIPKPKRTSPPGCDARHIPITAEEDLHSGTEAHGCRSDRWGHPCLDCFDRKAQTRTASPDFSSAKQKR
jgi:hypothetical protein